MAKRLPPLNALRAFEAAAKHQSFRDAAEELFVTPAAISHQIKSLEEYLGVRLFRREGRSLRLTEPALAGLPRLQEGFECLAEAVEKIAANQGTGTLTVSVAPTFAAKWLVPRMHRFATACPDVDLRITASLSLIDFSSTVPMTATDFLRQGIDVAIRFGTGSYPGLHVEELFATTVVPVCSPGLLAGDHPLREPEDLRFHTLLHDDTQLLGGSRPGWLVWLETADVHSVDANRGPRLSSMALALDAAIEGQGVVLSLRHLVEGDLRAGRLVVPFEIEFPVEMAYYVVCPEATADISRIVAFRKWVLAEAKRKI